MTGNYFWNSNHILVNDVLIVKRKMKHSSKISRVQIVIWPINGFIIFCIMDDFYKIHIYLKLLDK